MLAKKMRARSAQLGQPRLTKLASPPEESSALHGEHVTFHPLSADLARLSADLRDDVQHPSLVIARCEEHGLDRFTSQRVFDVLAHSHERGDHAGASHEFVAILQGFFDSYYYIENGSLASFGDLIRPYAQVASNGASVSLFMSPDNVVRFMNDTHAVPELTAAMATWFPDNKAHVLWAALQHALDTGSGLLQVAGVLIPNQGDLAASECLSKLSNCDPASLQGFAGALVAVPDMVPDVVAEPAAAPAPSRGGLAEKLRKRRLVEDQDPLLASAATVVDTRLRLSRGSSSALFESFDELWAMIEELDPSQPLFLEVSDMANRWSPFSLIGTATGTAVARDHLTFGTDSKPAMRVFGVQVDDLASLNAADRNGFVVHRTSESSAEVSSYMIPRPHLLAPSEARAWSEALMGLRSVETAFTDLAAISL